MLAQQEIELQVYQKDLYSIGGKEAFRKAKKETKTITNNKYGVYISYRQDGYTSVSDSDQEEDLNHHNNNSNNNNYHDDGDRDSDNDNWNESHLYHQQQRSRLGSEDNALIETKIIV